MFTSLSQRIALWYITCRIYVIKDMFYHNLCHISLFGPLNSGMTTCALQRDPLFLSPWLAAFVFDSVPGPHSPRTPKRRATPVFLSAKRNYTGAFLQSLFSLSSQCRFAVSRGVIVERRKQEEINRERQKADRQTRYIAWENRQKHFLLLTQMDLQIYKIN